MEVSLSYFIPHPRYCFICSRSSKKAYSSAVTLIRSKRPEAHPEIVVDAFVAIAINDIRHLLSDWWLWFIFNA